VDVSGNCKVLLPYQYSFTDDPTENIPASIREYAHDPPNVAYLIPHFHRWGFSAKNDKTKLWVGKGDWVRNGKRCSWDGTQELDLPSVNDQWLYVIAELKHDSDERDPSIEPNEVEVGIYYDPSDPDAYPKDSIELTSSPDEGSPTAYSRRNIRRVLGRVLIIQGDYLGAPEYRLASYEQWVFSDFDDESDIPDADHYCGLPEIQPIRRTINRNSSAASLHYLEWQLYDVDNATSRPHNGREHYVAVFQDGGLSGGGEVEGNLTWPALDSTLPWTTDSYMFRSLETYSLPAGGSAEYRAIFLYGFPEAEFCSVPYCDDVSTSGSSARSLVWRYPAVAAAEGGGYSPYKGRHSWSSDFVTSIESDTEFPPEDIDPERDICAGYCSIDWQSISGSVSNGAWSIGDEAMGGNAHVSVWIDPDKILEWRPYHHFLLPRQPPNIDEPPDYDPRGWAFNTNHDGRYVRPGVGHRSDTPSAWQSIGFLDMPQDTNGDWYDGALRIDLETCELVVGEDEGESRTVDWADCELRSPTDDVVTLDWHDRALLSGETSYTAEDNAWIVGDETFLHILSDVDGSYSLLDGALKVEGGIAVKGTSWFGNDVGIGDGTGGIVFDYLDDPEQLELYSSPSYAAKLATLGAVIGAKDGFGWLDSGTYVPLIAGARAEGWTAPAGTLARTDPDYAGQTVSASYTQSELQATDNAVKALSRIVAALITDLHASGDVHSLLDVSA